MADCNVCICEQVCKYNDGVNEYCKGRCPHFRHHIYYLEPTLLAEMRYLTPEENERKLEMYRKMSTTVEDIKFII